jgi:hypothetical protein
LIWRHAPQFSQLLALAENVQKTDDVIPVMELRVFHVCVDGLRFSLKFLHNLLHNDDPTVPNNPDFSHP